MGEIGYSMEELIPVVAELANRYTGYDSTSITYEKAQQLMEAVIYCIQEYERDDEESGILFADQSTLAGEKNAEKEESEESSLAIKAEEKNRSAKEAYQLGYQKVIEKARAAGERYNSIMASFRHYGNRAYRDTILKEMPAFFRHYDARFEPQNARIFLEYPLMVSLGGLKGIDQVAWYLRCVQLEQKFLAGLPEGYVEQALSTYCEDYGELLVNLPEIILEDMQRRSQASGKNTNPQEFVNEIIDRVYGGDEALKTYLLRSIPLPN